MSIYETKTWKETQINTLTPHIHGLEEILILWRLCYYPKYAVDSVHSLQNSYDMFKKTILQTQENHSET